MANQYKDLPQSSGGGGVTSLNSLTGGLTLTGTGGITITPSGSNIDIGFSGGGGTPGAPDQSLQYNNSGSFAGASLITPDSGFSFYNTGVTIGTLSNLFSYTNFNSNGWLPAHGSLALNQTDPNGGTTAALSSFASFGIDGPYHQETFSGSQQITLSMWMKGVSGGEVVYLGSINSISNFVTGSIDVFSSPITVTNSWARYAFTFSPTSACQALGVFQKSSSDQVYLFGPQYNLLSYASGFVPEGATQTVFGTGVAATNGVFTNLQVGNAISPFFLDPIGGAASGQPHRLYYNTAGNFMVYEDNSGAPQQVAVVGGAAHVISSIGSFNLSSGIAFVSDAACTTSSIISTMITSPSQPGVYQISVNTGSFSVQSYNTGFGGTNGSDSSTVQYYIVN